MMKFNAVLVFSALFLCQVPRLFSQGEEVDWMYPLSYETSNVSLFKISDNPGDIPGAVQVITSGQMKLYDFRNIGDVVNFAAGCFTAKDNIFSQFVFRGIGMPFDYNTRVLILIDGHPLNEPLGNSALDVTSMLLIPVDAVEQVEILKGPASSIYGTSAFMGIINIKTKTGFDGVKTDISTRFAYPGEKEFSVTYSNNFSQNSGILFSASQSVSDEEFDFHFMEPDKRVAEWNDGKSETEHYYLKLSLGKLTLTAAAGDFFHNFGGGFSYSVFSSGANYENEYRRFTEFKYELDLPDDILMNFRLYYDLYDYRDSFDYRPDAPVWFDLLLSESFGGEILAEIPAGDRYKLITGAEITLADTEIINGENTEPEKTYYAGVEEEFLLVKVYADNRYYILESACLNAGIQYSTHELMDDGYVFHGGLIWRAARDDLFKFSIRQGFRSPTIYEAFYTDSVDIKNNPDLKRETINSYEFTYEKKSGLWALAVSLYHNQFDDLIKDEERLDESTGMIEQYVNSPGFSTNGADLSVSHVSESGIQSSLNASLLDDNGNKLVNFPGYILSAGTCIPFTGKWTITVSARHISPRLARDLDTEMPSYTVVNAGMSSSGLFKYGNISFGISNCFGEEIATSLGDAYDSMYISSDKRIVYLNIRLEV